MTATADGGERARGGRAPGGLPVHGPRHPAGQRAEPDRTELPDVAALAQLAHDPAAPRRRPPRRPRPPPAPSAAPQNGYVFIADEVRPDPLPDQRRRKSAARRRSPTRPQSTARPPTASRSPPTASWAGSSATSATSPSSPSTTAPTPPWAGRSSPPRTAPASPTTAPATACSSPSKRWKRSETVTSWTV